MPVGTQALEQPPQSSPQAPHFTAHNCAQPAGGGGWPHFTEVATEAQRGVVTGPGSHSHVRTEVKVQQLPTHSTEGPSSHHLALPTTLLPLSGGHLTRWKPPLNEGVKVPAPSTEASPHPRAAGARPGLHHTWQEALWVTVLSTPPGSSPASATRQLSSRTL